MHRLSACSSGELREQEGHGKAGDVHKRHRKATPLNSAGVCFGLRINRTKNVTCNRWNVKQPHAKKSEPREDLHGRELSHCARHLTQGRKDLAEACCQASFFTAHSIESFHVLRRILFGGKNCPEYGQKKCHSTELKGVLYRQWNTALR